LGKVTALLKNNKAQETIDQVDLLLAGVSPRPTGPAATFQKNLYKLRDEAWMKRLQLEIDVANAGPKAGLGARLGEVAQRNRKILAEIRGVQERSKAVALLVKTETSSKTAQQAELSKAEETTIIVVPPAPGPVPTPTPTPTPAPTPAPMPATAPAPTQERETSGGRNPLKILNGETVPAPETSSPDASNAASKSG